MGAKQTIRKILFISLWLCIGGGMLTLLLAAINNKKKGLCKGYSISIKGGDKNRFIDEKDIEKLMLKNAGGTIKGQPVETVNLNKLEQELRKNVWVSRAELYFDNQDYLHVAVIEKEPVARVFTPDGNSFYIDSTANRLPLSDKLSARVPVFTGFTNAAKLAKADSAILDGIKTVAIFILQDDFWMAQVAQIELTETGNMEMVPVVGNHLIKLGTAENIDQKFRRLMIFYQQILSKTGFEKYKVIDVQYEGQVVVSKFAQDAKIDSVQLKKNVEKILQEAKQAQVDNVEKPIEIKGRYEIPVDTAREEKPELPAEELRTEEKKQDKPDEERKPKTLMPKKNVNN
ncbi:MAG TPA: cell division protein FtsQ/DivIB [Chitinophagaceae bacterium]|nr:cell division protein FtsQ/DivIB [Chitinophagaceae bacterium]